MSVEEVVAGLRGVLDLIAVARRRTAEAAVALSGAAVGFASAMAGSGRPEVADLASLDVHIQSQLRVADELAARCESLVNAIIDRLVGGSVPAPGTESASSADAVTGPISAHRRYSDVASRERERIGRTPSGHQARGAWIKDDGTVDVVESGPDTPWFAATRAELIRQGRASGDPAARLQRLATHVEVQLVVRRGAEVNAEAEAAAGRGETGRPPRPVRLSLRVSRQPCGTEPNIPPAAQRFSCDKQLGNIIRQVLPPGSSLVVVDPDDREWTYP